MVFGKSKILKRRKGGCECGMLMGGSKGGLGNSHASSKGEKRTESFRGLQQGKKGCRDAITSPDSGLRLVEKGGLQDRGPSRRVKGGKCFETARRGKKRNGDVSGLLSGTP